MKKISVYICLVLLALLVTSCSEFVTPVAYTRFETTGTQYAVYTANAVGTHIAVYKDEAEASKDWLPCADIEFSFNECHGSDDTLGDGKRYTLVDVRHGAYLTVLITKDSGLYSASKSIRLNGEIIPGKTEEYDACWILTFEDFPLVRTNPHGMIDPEAVNVIEYY